MAGKLATAILNNHRTMGWRSVDFCIAATIPVIDLRMRPVRIRPAGTLPTLLRLCGAGLRLWIDPIQSPVSSSTVRALMSSAFVFCGDSDETLVQ